MGNCQAAEAATVVVQHPGNGRVEMMYWSISAKEVMSSNPGYYVALVIQPPEQHPSNVNTSQPGKNQLKLLRPDDMLHIGHVYRLISFEDVIKEFTAKKSAKLGKLMKGSGDLGEKKRNLDSSCGANLENTQTTSNSLLQGRGSRSVARHHGGGGGQWKPALQSIAELQ